MADMTMSDLSREVVKVPRGAVLMRQGEIGKCAYFVVQGRLIVEREDQGQRIFIAEIGPRDLVGELAILDDSPRSATVTVAEDSLLILLNKHRIRSIIRRSPNIAELILKLLSHKLRKTHERFVKGIDLSNPVTWIKICSLLTLVAKSEDSPQTRYASFAEHLLLLLEVQSQHIPEILIRLDRSKLIRAAEGEIRSVNYEYVHAFLYHCKEDYSNEPMEEPTSLKEFMAIRLLLDQFTPDDVVSRTVSVPKHQVQDLLAQSNLWQYLHPTYQQQRAKAMMNSLSESSLIDQDPRVADNALLDLEMLNAFPPPEGEAKAFNMIQQALFGSIHNS